jgi:hypothetical protein
MARSPLRCTHNAKAAVAVPRGSGGWWINDFSFGSDSEIAASPD